MLYCNSIILVPMLIAGFYEEIRFLPYAEFVSQVREGKIKKVEIGEYTDLYGYYNINGEEKPFCTDYNVSNDVLLMNLLKSNNVTIAPLNKEKYEPPIIWFAIIPFFFPFVNLILIGFLIWKNVSLNKQMREILEKKEKS